jgi:hypothetical protein
MNDGSRVSEDLMDGIRLRIAEDGWILEYKGHKVKVLDHLFSSKAIEVIRRWLSGEVGIEIEGGKVWAILTQLMGSWHLSLEDARRLFPAIVGEDNNVKLAILSLLTLKLEGRDERIMGVIVMGRNSSGKSHFSKNLLKPLRDRVDEFTRMTGPFIERRFKDRNVDGRIIFLQEAGDIPSQLHISLSEGRLRIGVVERDGGSFKAVEVEAFGQPFFWTTSPSGAFSQSVRDRCIEILMDESEEQTKRIARFQAILNSDHVFKEGFERFKEGCCKIFKEYIWERIPENCRVVIPFLKLVEREFEGFEVDVKFRRDFNKLIALLKAHAILRWKDRWKLDLEANRLIPKGEPRDLEEFYKDSPDPKLLIIAEWEDFEEVYKLMETSFKPTITGFNDKEIRVLEELYRIKEKGEVRLSSSFYTELARRTGIPSSTIRQVIVPRLEKRGFLAVARDRRPHDIEVIKMPGDFILDIGRLRALAEAEVEAYVTKLKFSHEASYPLTPYCSTPKNGQNLGSSCQNEPEISAVCQTADSACFFGEKKPELSLSRDDEQEGADGQAILDLTANVATSSHIGAERANPLSKCGECIHWQAMKCEVHPEWVIVTPTARYAVTCPSFRPKSIEWGCGE